MWRRWAVLGPVGPMWGRVRGRVWVGMRSRPGLRPRGQGGAPAGAPAGCAAAATRSYSSRHTSPGPKHNPPADRDAAMPPRLGPDRTTARPCGDQWRRARHNADAARSAAGWRAASACRRRRASLPARCSAPASVFEGGVIERDRGRAPASGRPRQRAAHAHLGAAGEARRRAPWQPPCAAQRDDHAGTKVGDPDDSARSPFDSPVAPPQVVREARSAILLFPTCAVTTWTDTRSPPTWLPC